jgi:replicative DNA helicase
MAELQLVKNNIEMPKLENLQDFQKEMLQTIERVDEYAWNRGKLGGFSFGDPQMDSAFGGLQSHMYVIAGSPNIGKSALCLQLAWQVAQCNDDAYVLYFSLDDMATETLPRIMAADQRLSIEIFAKPEKFKDNANLMARRAKGFERLKQSVDRFKLIDRTECQTVEQVEALATQHKSLVEMHLGKKVCIFVDALNNLELEKRIDDKQERMKYISRTLKDITEVHDIPVVVTTHLKKLNGHRRPVADDIKETNDTQYDAYAIILCYSEVGIKGQNSKIYHEEVGREDRLPVLEGHVVKNKLGEFKNRLFWDFFPGNSYLQSVPAEGIRRYNTLIMS